VVAVMPVRTTPLRRWWRRGAPVGDPHESLGGAGPGVWYQAHRGRPLLPDIVGRRGWPHRTRKEAVGLRIDKIGVIGLGDTGSAVARRFLEQGFEVIVHDRDVWKMVAMVEAGAKAARIPADAAEPADLVVVHLPDDSAAEEVLFDCGGVGETLPDDGLVVATFAMEPVFVLSAADRLAALGLHIMEAWFLGDDPGTATTALAAGASEHLATVIPVFQAIGVDLARVGPLGSVAALRTALAAVRPPAGKALSSAAGSPVDGRVLPFPRRHGEGRRVSGDRPGGRAGGPEAAARSGDAFAFPHWRRP
jgi:hypothetical protein